MTTVRIESIGCRLNTGEMEALARTLAARGHRVVGVGEPASICIFNTCTVTAMASRKSRQILRQLRRANPDAHMVATGCYAEMDADAVSASGVDLVVGNRDKDRLADLLDERGWLDDGEADPSLHLSGPIGPSRERRTRAFLKVQDGCDNACAYCVVTVARGAGRSRGEQAILDDIDALTDGGYREIILTGVHLGSYGHDLGRRNGLRQLVERILELGTVPRLRLSSLEPWDLEPEFFRLFEDPRLLPHLHLPLQSGCDATLRRMARKITTRDFARLVEAARNRNPDLSISSDVIAGFPGETDAEFEKSFAFVRNMAFSHLHIFRFSPRNGTPAALMKPQVPGPTATERSRRLHELNAEAESVFARRFEGREVEVLWETSEPYCADRRWSGLTPHAIRATTETPAGVDLFNRITAARVDHAVAGAVAVTIDDAAISSASASGRTTGLPIVRKSRRNPRSATDSESEPTD